MASPVVIASDVLTIGQRTIGALGSDTWFRLELEPGTYDVRCSGNENSNSTLVQLASGETRLIETGIRFGWVSPRCSVFEVPAVTARPAVLANKRAREIR
jgi:hypothetical protein